MPHDTQVVGPGYLVRHLAEAPTVPCPCGQSTRIVTADDGPLANFHVTRITDSVKHYHKECTELYYILEGDGEIELGDHVVPVAPGTFLRIDPYTPHRLRSETGVTTLVIGLPACRHDDEFFVTDGPTP